MAPVQVDLTEVVGTGRFSFEEAAQVGRLPLTAKHFVTGWAGYRQLLERRTAQGTCSNAAEQGACTL